MLGNIVQIVRQNRQFLFVALLAFLSFASLGAQPQKSIRRAVEPVPDQFIVVFDESFVAREHVPDVAASMVQKAGGRLMGTFSNTIMGFGVEVPEGRINGLLHDPKVKYVEENFVGHLSAAVVFPDDTYYNLDRIDQHSAIGFPKSYGWTYNGATTDVYVVDTGVQKNHEQFFAGQVAAGADWAYDTYAPSNPCGGWVSSLNGGHGTSVASIVGGQLNPGIGVARGARIIPVKVFSCHPGVGYEITLNGFGAIVALDWIKQEVARTGRRGVVNISWYFFTGLNQCHYDGSQEMWDCVPAFESVIRDLLNAGVVVVASANNQNLNYCEGTVTQSPARMGYGGIFDPGNQPTWPFVITVGGTNINDVRYVCAACSTNERGSNFGRCVDIYAPAYSVRSATIASANSYRDHTDPTKSTGTSFAAPVVSGVAARILHKHPTWTPRQVWDYIYTNATTLASNHDGDGISANDRLVFLPTTD